MKKLISIFLLFSSVEAYSTEIGRAYICTPEASTGFRYEQGSWKIAQFSEKDFLIRILKKDDPGFINHKETPYAVFDPEEKVPDMYCAIRGLALTCSGLGELDFSSRTGRFIRTNMLSYISADEDDVAQPKITRGTCKPLPPNYKEPKKIERDLM